MSSVEPPPTISTDNRVRITWRRWLEVALVFLVCFVVGGAPVPHVNEAHYLAKAKHYWNPEWCTGDLFLESSAAHLTFYWTIGVLTKWFELPTVAWIGRVVGWLLLAWAWQRLVSRLVVLPFASVLSAMLLVWLVDRANFAGEWIVGGIEGKVFAYFFVIWALAEIVGGGFSPGGKWLRVWPLLGLASAFHVLVGGWSVLAALVVWTCDRNPARPKFRHMLPSLILGGAISVFGVVPALLLSTGVSSEVAARANEIYVFERLPHHLAPLELPTPELLRRAYRFVLMVVVGALLWLIVRQHSHSRNLSQDAESPSPADRGGAAATHRLYLIFTFATASLVFFALGLAWEIATWSHPTLSAKLLKYYWFRLADIAVPMAVAIAICRVIEDLVASKSSLAGWIALLAIVLPGWFLISTSTARSFDNTPPADRRMRNHAAWVETCDWVREHTPESAMFLVPRSSLTFKWYAERPELVTWKDVPQDAAALVEWWETYRDVFTWVDEWGERHTHSTLGELGTARIRELAARYHFDYVVADEYPPLQFPVEYANAWYTVYRVAPPAISE